MAQFLPHPNKWQAKSRFQRDLVCTALTAGCPIPTRFYAKWGDTLMYHRELLRDPLVGGQIRRRKAAVARLEWRLDGDDIPQNVRDTVQAA
ncbi:hypothetical protein [Kingella kingae]|uniref:hypothetical protein n=1 Tax=Kingella kingae TaxID=504 RepID=UPI00041CBFDE|nr:hypothetical protein [Kingella kingae]